MGIYAYNEAWITKHHKTKVQQTWKTRTLPSEPPHDDKEPKDKDEEDDVPQPSTPLTCGHIVHAPKRARENAGRLRKRVVLHTQVRKEKTRLLVMQGHSVGMVCVERTRTHTIWLSWMVESRTSFPIPIVI